MANLNSRSFIHPRYTQSARKFADSFANCTIQIIDPKSDSGDESYSPWTNAATTDTTQVVWTGSADMIVYRNSLLTYQPEQAITYERSVRFTLRNGALKGVQINKGYWIRITDAPHNEDLESYLYVILNDVNSELALTANIEATVDMSVRVNWTD